MVEIICIGTLRGKEVFVLVHYSNSVRSLGTLTYVFLVSSPNAHVIRAAVYFLIP